MPTRYNGSPAGWCLATDAAKIRTFASVEGRWLVKGWLISRSEKKMPNPTPNQLLDALSDRRSRRVVFVSHCILNENVRYLGGAGRRGTVDELVDYFQAAGVGMVQMPCPEQVAWGGVLKRYMMPIYGSHGTLRYRIRRPLTWAFLGYTRLVYRRLARRVAREVADYIRSGFEVLGVIGIGTSPSCGVFHTLDVHRALDVLAQYDKASMDSDQLNDALMTSARKHGRGYFVHALQRELTRRHLEVSFFEHDLASELRGEPVEIPRLRKTGGDGTATAHIAEPQS